VQRAVVARDLAVDEGLRAGPLDLAIRGAAVVAELVAVVALLAGLVHHAVAAEGIRTTTAGAAGAAGAAGSTVASGAGLASGLVVAVTPVAAGEGNGEQAREDHRPEERTRPHYQPRTQAGAFRRQERNDSRIHRRSGSTRESAVAAADSLRSPFFRLLPRRGWGTFGPNDGLCAVLFGESFGMGRGAHARFLRPRPLYLRRPPGDTASGRRSPRPSGPAD